MLAPSNCNDLVTLDSQTIISGHYDKKIRFWDARGGAARSEILFEGKVTSVDLSQSKNHVLASVKEENILSLVDIRMMKTVSEYVSDEFKIPTDWSRAIFSPDYDHQHVCAGSENGAIIIWNTKSTRVEKILKEHT